MVEKIGGVVIIGLLALWGAEKVYPSPQQVVTQQPVLVPVYELRQQQNELWMKTGHWLVRV
ncbi:hypothetical protein [Mesorhizobium sp. NZP2077]|uniref:hypothetical protein n=1 Tax=Mesorhizobium sp. NZP2077 TaxID=2483404 RepID=UPI00155629E7|nr:hypothetical protein [Mesorhizobium sp. NZP2077]QKC84395.1 hypothetical protein EB232_24875 [Mesorhizobium sp. NZP2077]QKD17955.1 hypothetical protein HGP13_24575 [Mesorhizobium sp. NZP2077]